MMKTLGRICWALTLGMIYTACFVRWPTITFTTFALYATRDLWEKEPTK